MSHLTDQPGPTSPTPLQQEAHRRLHEFLANTADTIRFSWEDDRRRIVGLEEENRRLRDAIHDLGRLSRGTQ